MVRGKKEVRKSSKYDKIEAVADYYNLGGTYLSQHISTALNILKKEFDEFITIFSHF